MGDTIDQAMAECQKFRNDCAQQGWFVDEQPPHQVYLSAYWIDRTDVTNAMYALCVQAGACQPPARTFSHTRSSYYGYSLYADYPVIYVNWFQASAYCEWAGAHLPTEAEWEKAARGTDGRTYPWGNSSPNKFSLNYNLNVGDTTAVGSYPSGASPYGVLDMAGNVFQWVAEENQALRGGTWYFSEIYVRSAAISGFVLPITASSDFVGFRCSRSFP